MVQLRTPWGLILKVLGTIAVLITIYQFSSLIVETVYVTYLAVFALGYLASDIVSRIRFVVDQYFKPDTSIILHSSFNEVQRQEFLKIVESSEKVRYFEITLDQFSLYRRGEARWSDAMKFQERQFKKNIRRIRYSEKMFYFGNPNISAIIHLGTLFSLRYKITLNQHNREDGNNYWGWKSKRKPANWRVNISEYEQILEKTPNLIGLLVENSSDIDETYVRHWLPNEPLVTVSVPDPSIHDLQIFTQVTEMVNSIKSVLDSFRGCRIIHLFTAVPVPVAFYLGQNISNTMHPKIQLYEFVQSEEPKYLPSIVIN